MAIMPGDFINALRAAGIVEDTDRISEVKIVARPDEVVTIEVTYIADQRIYRLTEPK